MWTALILAFSLASIQAPVVSTSDISKSSSSSVPIQMVLDEEAELKFFSPKKLLLEGFGLGAVVPVQSHPFSKLLSSRVLRAVRREFQRLVFLSDSSPRAPPV